MYSHKDIEVLEKKHRKYKNKKRLKALAFIVPSVLIVLGLSLPFFLNQKKEKPLAIIPPPLIKPTQATTATVPKTTSHPPIQATQKEPEPKPEPKPVQKEAIEQNSKQTTQKHEPKTVVLQENSDFLDALQEQIDQEKIKEETKTPITINSKKSVDLIEQALELYKKNKTYENAIALSQLYLEKKLYQNCIKYSLEANNLDTSKQESWLLFAQAKYFLGDKEKAIKALSSYLNQYESPKAKELLEKINKGTLK